LYGWILKSPLSAAGAQYAERESEVFAWLLWHCHRVPALAPAAVRLSGARDLSRVQPLAARGGPYEVIERYEGEAMASHPASWPESWRSSTSASTR